MAKSKKPPEYVFADVSTHPFPFTVLFMAGNWKAAAGNIDNILEDKRNPDGKPSEKVLQAIEATDFADDDCQAITIFNPELLNNVVIIVARSPQPSLNVIVHECLHATMTILDRVGCKDVNHETDAYLLEHMVEVCVNATGENKWHIK